MPILTPLQIGAIAAIAVVIWLSGFLSRSSGRKWRKRFEQERDFYAAYRAENDALHQQKNQRIAALEAHIATLPPVAVPAPVEPAPLPHIEPIVPVVLATEHAAPEEHPQDTPSESNVEPVAEHSAPPEIEVEPKADTEAVEVPGEPITLHAQPIIEAGHEAADQHVEDMPHDAVVAADAAAPLEIHDHEVVEANVVEHHAGEPHAIEPHVIEAHDVADHASDAVVHLDAHAEPVSTHDDGASIHPTPVEHATIDVEPAPLETAHHDPLEAEIPTPFWAAPVTAAAEVTPVVEAVPLHDAVIVEHTPEPIVVDHAPVESVVVAESHDDLSRLRGINPDVHDKLKALGIHHYEDIEKLSAEDEMALEERLSLPVGHIAREQWRSQAALLRAGNEREFADRYGLVGA
jgi:predicted flap endonuclease-1-like 5' DNA nuclease